MSKTRSIHPEFSIVEQSEANEAKFLLEKNDKQVPDNRRFKGCVANFIFA